MRIKLVAAGLAILSGALATPAQTGGVKVHVPFEFGVANRTFAPGEYVLWSTRDEVFIRVASGKTVVMVQSNRIVGEGGATGKVVFKCYASRCFLLKLLTPDAEAGREIAESK